MKVLLDWLTAEGNYAMWKGGDSSTGPTKEALCGVIIDKLKDVGITHRKSADYREQLMMLRSARLFFSCVPATISSHADKRNRKRRLSIAEITSEETHDWHMTLRRTEQQEPRPQDRDSADTEWLELEEKKLELEMRREAREEAKANAEVELINDKRRSVEIDNTTRLLLARKQLKDAGYTDEEVDAHLPLNT
ncbi:hypothetical protein F442_17824 [Phytophthora nicotianae P10297]|uniref:Uncharacterized protein n=1 Tax=Phytophthora nicotianae P10297 TaxID=1317064 RepID=W2YF99_PHYNI|nr:hypothetical protein F442_17824 [Phytophthora nicotianae P10297]